MTAPRAFAVYLGAAALMSWNLLPRIATDLFSDLGDPLLNTAILAWNARHVPLSTEWWNFPSFAPLEGVTAFTESVYHFVVLDVSGPSLTLRAIRRDGTEMDRMTITKAP